MAVSSCTPSQKCGRGRDTEESLQGQGRLDHKSSSRLARVPYSDLTSNNKEVELEMKFTNSPIHNKGYLEI